MFSCNISCNGLYADVQHQNRESKNDEMFNTIQKSYKRYKNSFAQNIEFYQDSIRDVELSTLDHFIYDNAFVKDYPDLIFVDIFFDTATYDRIDRDIKITTEAALGLVGGTMGLLTGFSILSGVEILYFGINFLVSLCSRGKY